MTPINVEKGKNSFIVFSDAKKFMSSFTGVRDLLTLSFTEK